MHYKNGREAKENDSVITTGWVGSNRAVAGTIFNLNATSESCNGLIAVPTAGGLQNVCVTVGDCFHAEDALATMLAMIPKAATILIALLMLFCFSASAQTNTPTGTFFGTVQSYFTSFNTNLDDTFATERGSLWTSFDSIQGGAVPLANSIGLSYNLWKSIQAEAVVRNSGIAGTIVSGQGGFGLNFIVHDVKLTAYGDAGYAFSEPGQKLYGEFGLRVFKALTEHTYAGCGVGVQVPANRQVFSLFTGFTF